MLIRHGQFRAVTRGAFGSTRSASFPKHLQSPPSDVPTCRCWCRCGARYGANRLCDNSSGHRGAAVPADAGRHEAERRPRRPCWLPYRVLHRRQPRAAPPAPAAVRHPSEPSTAACSSWCAHIKKLRDLLPPTTWKQTVGLGGCHSTLDSHWPHALHPTRSHTVSGGGDVP